MQAQTPSPAAGPRVEDPARFASSALPCDVLPSVLPYVTTYRFFDTALRVRTDSDRVHSCLRDLYSRFRIPGAGYCKDLRVITGDGSGSSGLRMRSPDHEYLVFKEARGFLLKCEYRRTRSVDWIRFDPEGTHRVSAPEILCPPRNGTSDDDETHLLSIVQMVFLRTVAESLPGRHLLHAAALSWNGSGVLLAGESGRGKTLLSVALTGLGCRFLSDDVACLRFDPVELEPFPRGLNVCSSGLALLDALLGAEQVGELHEGRAVDVESLFPRSLGRACSPRVFFLLGRFGTRARIRPIAKRLALWRALKLSHSPVTEPGRLLMALGPLFEQASCFELHAGDPESTAELILDLVERDRA